MDSDSSTGFFFERGPRVFRGSRSSDFLKLVHEIGLGSELIESKKEGRSRYLWIQGKLRKMPILSWGLVKGLLKEWREPPQSDADESVWDFACRRFNQTVAEHLFDPLVVGIYGGDVKELSMRSCFPLYKKMEERHGSVIKGLLRQGRVQGRVPYMFGFQRGVKSVIQRLQERAAIPFHLEEEVVAITLKGAAFEVKTSKGVHEADYLFSALAPPVIGKLLIPELASLPMEGVTMVNLGYGKKVLKKKGFGYLVSSKEGEEVLGVVFDSNVFPQYNRRPEETRLTVKLKRADVSESEARFLALKGIEKHLGITELPDVSMVVRAPSVFPQFLVGHHRRMQTLEQEVAERYPHLRLLGNYLDGVSVNDCIARARSVVASFLSASES